MAFHPNTDHKIHVLLVEHDTKDLDKTMNMLHYFSYEVTQVNLASAAVSILSKAKIKFDLVMANMNSPDSCSLQLLQDATKKDLLVILMSSDDDPITTTRALQQGAFLCIRKPVTMQITGYLWQHVFREKTRKQFKEVIDYNNQDFRDQERRIEGNQNNNKSGEERHKSKKKLNPGTTSRNENDNELKKKVWIEWTEELHYKFMAAVIQLGEGRCYPKEILELMNEPRLTRMQVASHLQKCRNAKWLPPGERKSKPTGIEPTTARNKVRRSKNERFGSMPLIDKHSQFNLIIRGQKYHHDEQSTVAPPVQTNAHGDRNDGVYYPQLFQGHDSNYPFTHDHNELFNMGHLGQTPSDVTDDDTMVQIFSALQQDLEMDYNLNQMTNVSNTSSEWSQEEQESVNDDETEG